MLTSLPFDDLMRECGFTDAADFMRTLKANHFQIKRGRDVSSTVANDIVKRLQGRKIDWYAYKQRERDRADGGLLTRSRNPELASAVEEFWRLFPSASESAAHRQLIGIVCTGGFLTGENGGPFVMPFNQGITILLGDRGSGKSTVLNLLSVLGPPSNNSGVLVTKLMQLLREEPDGDLNGARRIHGTLRHYGVNQYACFHSRDNAIYCYIADIERGQFALLKRNRDRFEIIEDEFDTIEMQILQQGEVFRIADASNQFYLNSLLDALFPMLDARRRAFMDAVKRHEEIVRHLEQPATRTPFTEFDRFVHRRRRELNRLNNAVVRGLLDEGARAILARYLELSRPKDDQALPVTIWECLNLEDPETHAFWHMYLHRASSYLAREIPAVLRWQSTEDAVANEQFAALWADEWDDDESAEDDDDATDDIIELPIDIESEVRQPREALAEISKGLRQWLRRLSRWYHQFNSRWAWDEHLRALAASYSELLSAHIELVKTQDQTCEQITNLLSQDGTVVRVFTSDTTNLIGTATSELQALATIPAADIALRTTSWRSSRTDVESNLFRYLNATSRMIERSKRIAFADQVKQQMSYSQIDIELRQGSEFRSFGQLSFGQKSGIILKMVLSATSKRAVIIDQPEDNLDTNAIVHMLGPALKTLGSDRQVIIATHSSNLIMGLPDATLVVLESSGAYGRVVTQGSLLTQALTRAVLDILEGGATAFETKLKTYEQFVRQLTGQIRDMDINAIESTFRRRAIDGLRNFLQPVVSDRAMLDFFRHELRQPSRLGSHIREAKSALERSTRSPQTSEVDLRIERVLDTLDGHVTKLQATIEEMRMLDTQPRKSQTRLGPLLRTLAEEYTSRFGHSYRRIVITVDDALHEEEIFADPDHLRLVFANLFKNSLRATELKAAAELRPDTAPYQENLALCLGATDKSSVRLLLHDNGRGIPATIAPKLYQEKCSDQLGEGHGLGGIIIRKILDLNDGSIRIVSSAAGRGTVQELTFVRSETL